MPRSQADPRHLNEKAVFTAPLSRNASNNHENIYRRTNFTGPLPDAPQGYIPNRFVPGEMGPTHAGISGPPDEVPPKSDEWDTLADLLRDHDSFKVANCNGDIDSLLIFVSISFFSECLPPEHPTMFRLVCSLP